MEHKFSVSEDIIRCIKKYHDITKIYDETGILEEFALKYLINNCGDNYDVLEALYNYYNRYNIIGNRIFIIADTHLCGREASYDMLKKVYLCAKQQRCSAIIHLGDVIEGDVGKEQINLSIEDQLHDVVRNYPETNIPTYYIQGNHDIPNPNSKSLPETYRKILSERSDLKWVGNCNALIKINGKFIRLFHHKCYNIPIPNYPYNLQLNGHSHLKRFEDNKVFTVPPLSTRVLDGKTPGFTVLTEYKDVYELDTYRQNQDNEFESDKEKIYVRK